jgi:hypothetical protein
MRFHPLGELACIQLARLFHLHQASRTRSGPPLLVLRTSAVAPRSSAPTLATRRARPLPRRRTRSVRSAHRERRRSSRPTTTWRPGSRCSCWKWIPQQPLATFHRSQIFRSASGR